MRLARFMPKLYNEAPLWTTCDAMYVLSVSRIILTI